MSHIDSRSSLTAGATARLRSLLSPQSNRVLVAGLIAGAVVVTGSACGSAAKTSSPVKAPVKAAAPKIVNISAIGKIDTDTGPAGSFTSKEHWPAMAPSDLKVTKGDTVVLTVKEYDDAPTALPAGSPYNKVAGGTMTVDGVAGTTVSNANIAHTFSIPELGVNVPLTKAPEGKTTTTVFTFKVAKSGTFTWHCFTPCGGEPGGMGGSMATNGWMQGNLVVA